MNCQECGDVMTWHGSLSRGKMMCTNCIPVEESVKVFHWQGGMVSPTMYRYYTESQAWHRDWCHAMRVRQGKGSKTDPTLCNCGHTQATPLTPADIEQREIANYGVATMQPPAVISSSAPIPATVITIPLVVDDADSFRALPKYRQMANFVFAGEETVSCPDDGQLYIIDPSRGLAGWKEANVRQEFSSCRGCGSDELRLDITQHHRKIHGVFSTSFTADLWCLSCGRQCDPYPMPESLRLSPDDIAAVDLLWSGDTP